MTKLVKGVVAAHIELKDEIPFVISATCKVPFIFNPTFFRRRKLRETVYHFFLRAFFIHGIGFAITSSKFKWIGMSQMKPHMFCCKYSVDFFNVQSCGATTFSAVELLIGLAPNDCLTKICFVFVSLPLSACIL